jgi:solute carrier family 45 protein 1/2/4
MTGGGFVSGGGEEYDLGGPSHAVQWVGTPSVKGPRWAKMPLLTVGMLGIQVCRSVPYINDPLFDADELVRLVN